jgi:ferritin-like metal-binding protein YciE
MAQAATSTQLKRASQEHLKQSNNHVRRLEQIFDGMGEQAKATKCKGVRGIIEEGEDLMDQDATSPVADAALIGSAQKVEHYEMAAYGAVRAYAEALGHDEAARPATRS